jgi:hypothetical protein
MLEIDDRIIIKPANKVANTPITFFNELLSQIAKNTDKTKTPKDMNFFK